MTEATRKATRDASWARGKVRKQARRTAQDVARRRNRELTAAGELTPWQTARGRRLERRAIGRRNSPQAA